MHEISWKFFRARFRKLTTPPQKEAYEAVVSLGGLCQVAYQIEKRFGCRVSSPFDWLVVPLEAIGRIFSDNGIHLGRDIEKSIDGSIAISSAYGVAYYHDFVRDNNYTITLSQSALDSAADKYAAKYSKFSSTLALRPKTLFVRLGGHHESLLPSPYVSEERSTRTDDLNALCSQIDRTFSGLIFKLLFVYYRGVSKIEIEHSMLDSRVSIFALDADENYGWEGDTVAWASIFEKFDVQIDNAKAKACQFGENAVEFEILHQ